MALAARDPHAAQENREKVLKSFETFHANFIFRAAAGGTFDFWSLHSVSARANSEMYAQIYFRAPFSEVVVPSDKLSEFKRSRWQHVGST